VSEFGQWLGRLDATTWALIGLLFVTMGMVAWGAATMGNPDSPPLPRRPVPLPKAKPAWARPPELVEPDYAPRHDKEARGQSTTRLSWTGEYPQVPEPPRPPRMRIVGEGEGGEAWWRSYE
jgi:hypothetical protein